MWILNFNDSMSDPIQNDYKNIASPAYVLEKEKLIRNLELLHNVKQQAGISIILALKAWAVWPLFPLIRNFLDGATASSLNEARLIYDHMNEPAHVYAPVFQQRERKEMSLVADTIIFNSLSEYNRHYREFRLFNPDLKFGLRVNPGYSEIHTPLYDPSGPGSRLGVHHLSSLPRGISGLHFHALCENNSYTFDRVLQSFESKYKDLLPYLEWVNFGGGHLITDKNYHIPHLLKVLKSFKERYSHLKIIMEPGAAVVWKTGFLKTTVQDVIDSPDRKFLMLDISFTAHTPDCLEMPYNPEIRNASYGTKGPHVYYLGGTSCLAGDQLGPYSFNREMKTGDTLILEDMAHYTIVKTTMFNGVHHPDIGLLERSGEYKLLRRFSYKDYESRMG